MVTGGQLSSLSTGGGAVSPTACDFEPNSWLNRLLIEELELVSGVASSVLPPPQPERVVPAIISANTMRRRPARLIVRIISPLRIIRKIPKTSRSNAPFPGRSARGRRVIPAQ